MKARKLAGASPDADTAIQALRQLSAGDGAFEMPDRAEEFSSADTARIKLFIDGFFLGLISLVCLAVFFTAHDHWGDWFCGIRALLL
jgi:hypothetical protein